MFIICFNEQLGGNFHILPILVLILAHSSYHYNGLHRPLKHFMFIRHYFVLVYLHFHIISRVDLLVFNNFNYQRVQITLPHQRSFSFFLEWEEYRRDKTIPFWWTSFTFWVAYMFPSTTSTSLHLYCFPPPPPQHISFIFLLLHQHHIYFFFLLLHQHHISLVFLLHRHQHISFVSSSTTTTFSSFFLTDRLFRRSDRLFER